MIETPRLDIVPLSTEHLEDIRQMRLTPSTWRWLSDVSPISDEQQKQWFRGLQNDVSKMYLAIRSKMTKVPHDWGITWTTPEIVGLLRADEWDKTNRSIRIGVDIRPASRGQGYGTEAFQAFIDYLFLHQNIHRIWFLVAEPNKVARELYKKLGFKEEGKQREAIYRNGKYWDYIMMSMLEKEYFARRKNEKEQ